MQGRISKQSRLSHSSRQEGAEGTCGAAYAMLIHAYNMQIHVSIYIYMYIYIYMRVCERRYLYGIHQYTYKDMYFYIYI